MGNKVIFILGTGHCGSTLLDLLLGSHSKAVSLGEVYTVINKKNTVKLCDFCEDECSLWSRGLHKELLSVYNRNLFQRIITKIGLIPKAEVSFYNSISEKSERNILIDSSKNAGWILRNGRVLKNNKYYKPILLYLSRDGRAVVNSYYRKYPHRGLEKIAYNWNNRISKINGCYEKWPNSYKIHIRYEDLSQKPVETIKSILDFIDEPYEPSMMRFWEHNHHLLNGNAGTKSMLIKFQKQHLHKNWIQVNEKGYYKNHELGIKFDERWITELKKEELAKINDIIAKYNQDLIDE
jgi:hypothetical protein